MRNWYFPSAKGIGINGFNNIGEEFKDNPIQSLAKEICQNSLDTKLNPEYKNSEKKIKVVFNQFLMEAKNFPGKEEFLKVLLNEYDYNDSYYINDKTVPNFYKNAIECLQSKKICCLRISDYNTTGLLGADKSSHSPWCDLTKNAGVSDKPEGSGGSKGKGKFASFVCSSLYTVFYSTYAMDEVKASCGIARLSGYELENGNKTIGEGYYEEEDGNIIKEILTFDDNYLRENYGTDIYIMGFRSNNEKWREKIIASIIDNFLVAIIKDELEVEVDEYVLSSRTIDNLMQNNEIKGYLDPVTEKYYDIMVSNEENLIVESYSMFEQNDLILKIKIDKSNEAYLINKVAAVRSTGMKILDMKSLPRLGFYHGILEMKGVKINDYFRKLENATHNTWSESRGDNVAEAKERIDELKYFVRNTIKKHMTNSLLDEIDAEGVGEFLPDEDEITSNNSDEEQAESIENEEVKTIEIEEKIIQNKERNTKSDTGEDDIELNDEGNIILPNYKQNDEPNPEPGPKPNPFEHDKIRYTNITRKIIPKKLRVFEENGKYQLIFSAMDNEPIVKIEITIYGENSNEITKIKNVQARKANKLINSKIKVECLGNTVNIKDILKDDIYILDFELETDEIWTLEVKVYGNNE